MDSDERSRSTRFATPDLRRRFVTGRAALRSALSMLEAGTVPETEWRFGAFRNGKPYVRAPKSAIRSFNLSYADDLIAIAVSKELEVGVDIERSHEIPQGEIPWHLFSANEQTLLGSAREGDFMRAFLRLWTLKEAIAKCAGQGFAIAFNEIDTMALPVVEGLHSLGDHVTAGTLLFHMDLTIEGKIVFLSVSTAPFGGDNDGPVG